MEALKSIGAIVIDYNSYERTLKYIQDLISASDIKLKCIIIIDNSPKIENSIKIANTLMLSETIITETQDIIVAYSVDKQFLGICAETEIILLHTFANIGFAKGNNLGFIILKKIYSIDFVLFSNNDVLFIDNKIKISLLLEVFSEDYRIGIVGPDVIGLDGKHQSPCKYLNLFNRIWRNYYICALPGLHGVSVSDLITEPKRGNVYRLIGAFFIADANVFSEIGMFDENTFLYAEELILSDRLRKNNYEVFFEPSVTVIHEGGYTTSKAGIINVKNKIKIRKTIIESNLYYYRAYRNYGKSLIMLTKMVGELHCWLVGLKWLLRNYREKQK